MRTIQKFMYKNSKLYWKNCILKSLNAEFDGTFWYEVFYGEFFVRVCCFLLPERDRACIEFEKPSTART